MRNTMKFTMFSSDTYIMWETVHYWLSTYVTSFSRYFCGHT